MQKTYNRSSMLPQASSSQSIVTYQCYELTIDDEPWYADTWLHDATSIQFPENCVFCWLLMNVLTRFKSAMEDEPALVLCTSYDMEPCILMSMSAQNGATR